jgi:putative transposase
MPHLAPPPLKLTPAEREQLTQLVSRHSTPQQIALRANIVLLADQGLNHRGIMDHLNISRDMARLWRNRWLELSAKKTPVLDRLADEPRSGTPAKFSLEQMVNLIALACEKPSQYGRPISHWTARELADEAMKQGIVECISPRHVGRLLQEADLKPHQSQYWLNPPPTLNSRQKSKTSAPSTAKPSNATSKGNGRSVLMK